MKPRNITVVPMLAEYGSSIIPAKCAVHKDGAERDLEGVSASSDSLCSEVWDRERRILNATAMTSQLSGL